MNGNKQQKNYQNIINLTSAGIESNRIQEKISGNVDDVIKDVEKHSLLQADGSIQDLTINHIPVFSCGCASKGMENVGARCDICGKIPCINHSLRCLRCRKSICVNCLKGTPEKPLCNRCWWLLATIIRHRRQQYEL